MKSKKRILTTVLLLAALVSGAVFLMAERSTLLNQAVRHCSPLSVRLLTALGADVNVENALAHLRFPADRKEACMEVARLLIAAGADVNADAYGGFSLLTDAVMFDTGFAKLLIDSGADVNQGSSVFLGYERHVTPLMKSIQMAKIPSVRLLIDAGADLNQMQTDVLDDECAGVKGWSMTPLMFNARFALFADKSIEIESMLIDAGADPNFQNPCGYTALMYAVQKSEGPFREMTRRLIKAGANLNLANHDGQTALMIALGWRRHDATKMLIDAGADLNLADRKGWTALMIASDQGDMEMVEALIQAGADLNATDLNCETALDHASQKGHLEVVKALLKAGAALKTACGAALLPASKGGNLEVVNALLEAGADVNARQNDRTPLMLASEEGHLDVVESLLAAGADVNAKGQDGVGAFNDHLLKIQEMLKAAGAQ